MRDTTHPATRVLVSVPEVRANSTLAGAIQRHYLCGNTHLSQMLAAVLPYVIGCVRLRIDIGNRTRHN